MICRRRAYRRGRAADAIARRPLRLSRRRPPISDSSPFPRRGENANIAGMDRQIAMRTERRIRMWILEQELECRRQSPRPVPPPPGARQRS
jgi:hypothetical protein